MLQVGEDDGEEIEEIGSGAAIAAAKESGETKQLEHIKSHIRRAQLAQAILIAESLEKNAATRVRLVNRLRRFKT